MISCAILTKTICGKIAGTCFGLERGEDYVNGDCAAARRTGAGDRFSDQLHYGGQHCHCDGDCPWHRREDDL